MEGGESSSTDKAAEEAPKRGRGRPRKEKTEEVRQRFLCLACRVLSFTIRYHNKGTVRYTESRGGIGERGSRPYLNSLLDFLWPVDPKSFIL